MAQADRARTTRAPSTHVWNVEPHVLEALAWIREELLIHAAVRPTMTVSDAMAAADKLCNAMRWALHMVPMTSPENTRLFELFFAFSFYRYPPHYRLRPIAQIAAELPTNISEGA